VIARLAGVAIDARTVARRSEPRDRESAARWIIANIAAAMRVPVPAHLPWSWRVALRALGVDHETTRRLAA
jgi:hypothetical protein